MSLISARLALVFSCVAHSYAHLFQPIFYVVVLVLEREMGLSHGEAISLIVVGNVLFGVAAPVAGWFGDRWSAVGMMGLYFVGTGGTMIMAGLAETPFEIAMWLAVTGLFASIYHPVGMAWLVRNAINRATALGFNGFFGNAGTVAAFLLTGAIIDMFGWRAAFIAPGVLILLTGGVFYFLIARGLIVESKSDRRADPPAPRRDAIRAVAVLALTMLCNGIIYQATQAALPKAFSERVVEFASGATSIGLIVAVVYVSGAFSQVLAGRIADRFPLKTVYIATLLFQSPFLLLASNLAGMPLVMIAAVMAAANVAVLPAENALIARYSPSRWRGVAYGLKFVIAGGIAGLGVKLEGYLYDLTGDFIWLFVVLGALAATAAFVALFLPPGVRQPVAVAAK